MDYFYGSIDPVSVLGPSLSSPYRTSRMTPEEISKEFMSIFMAEFLKPIFKNEEKNDTLGGTNLPGFEIYNDLFINQMAQNLVEKGILPSHFTKWPK